MASESPEGSEQFGDAAWGEEGQGYEDSNETQHSDEQVQDPDFSQAQDSQGDQNNQEQDGGEGQAEDESEEGGEAEYDPESVSMTPIPNVATELPQPQTGEAEAAAAAAVPAPSSKPRPNKPKKSGGFLVGDSDDEDDAPPPNNGAGFGDGNAFQSSPPNIVTSHQSLGGSSASVNGGGPGIASGPAAQTVTVDAARAPSDVVGILEDRVREDPRGDMDAWLALIAEHRRLNQLDQLRQVYERFVSVFPQAAEIWIQWINLELDSMNTTAAETLFQRSLLSVSNVPLWTAYINYIRRRNDLTNDTTGQARQVINQSYEFIINNVGVDRESGQLWKDWIQFIKSGPGQIGGSGWQDQQKMDQLRRAYHRAVTIPMTAVTELWKDYDQFELGLNKATGRQFIQKRSPAYMTAKSASLQLDRKTAKLNRTSLPRLPPLPGFAGEQEYKEQVDLWKQLIQWEKEDPLVLKDEEPEAYKQRILYAYKQALMALRFWPEMWVDAAEWCFENNIHKDGNDMGLKFLSDGIEANPESVLLALKLGDRTEMTHPLGDTEEAKEARIQAIRKPYDGVLDTLYKMMQKLKEREKKEVAQIEQSASLAAPAQHVEPRNDDDEADDAAGGVQNSGNEERIKAIKQGFAAQTELLKRTISFVWIATCRAARRTQGKGSLQSGLRGVFGDARAKGQLTSDVYVAVAQLEHVVYKDPAGAKIFDRGAKLFPEDENFMLEYIKFLHSKDDTTNARVVFETFVNRLTQSPEKKHRTKALYLYFHKYESQFGELSSVAALEKRMNELWPEDPKLSHFANRFSVDNFDPVAYRLIISPLVQLRPKVMPSIEQPTSVRDSPMPVAPPPPPIRQTASPAPQFGGTTHSPKRPFPDYDQEELNRPRKLARGESPLKGAAGRRLDQQRRNHGAPLPKDITFLLGILPATRWFNGPLFSAGKLANLIKDTHVPDFPTWRSSSDRGSRQTSAQPRAVPPASHTRQVSGEQPPYGSLQQNSGRNSPNPRPLSPFDGGHARRIASQAGYRNSPLRPDQGAAFGSPPLGYGQEGGPYAQPPPASQWPPPHPSSMESGAPPQWPPPPQSYGQYQY